MTDNKELNLDMIAKTDSLRSLEEIKTMAKKLFEQYQSMAGHSNAIRMRVFDRLLALAYVLKINLILSQDLTFAQKIIDLYNDLT